MSRQSVVRSLDQALRRLFPGRFRERRLDADSRLSRLDAEQRARLAANLQQLVRPKEANAPRAAS